jgi:hypothetical protein
LLQEDGVKKAVEAPIQEDGLKKAVLLRFKVVLPH